MDRINRLPLLVVLICFSCIVTTATAAQAVRSPQCYNGGGRRTYDVDVGTCHSRTPRSAVDICPTFVLYNTATTTKGGVDVTGLTNLPMDFTRDVKVLVPGFNGEEHEVKWATLREELLNQSFNVIVANWSQAANLSNFVQARADAREVGYQLSQLLAEVVRQSNGVMGHGNIHLIGGGLGAHVAGYAGEYGETVGRITGLDPTGGDLSTFGLSDGELRGQECRLDISDATFVDVIHTNTYSESNWGFTGTPIQMGHQDFYPNHGSDQPGCNGDELCSHTRALDYFMESVSNVDGLRFAPYCKSLFPDMCESSLDLCDEADPCPEMGFWAEKIKGDGYAYYLETYSTSPFSMTPVTTTVPPTTTTVPTTTPATTTTMAPTTTAPPTTTTAAPAAGNMQ